MGLLDMFGMGDAPQGLLGDGQSTWMTPQRMGMLNAAAALAQASGPSRLPVSLASALGSAIQGGMQAYTGAKKDQQTQLLDALRMKLGQQNLDSGALDIREKTRKFDDADQARKILQDVYGASGVPGNQQSMTAPVGAAPIGIPAHGDMGMAPPIPTAQPGTVAGGVTPKASVWQQFKATGDRMASSGLMDQAQMYWDKAEKFRPKLKDEQVRLQGNTPVVVRNYEDGSTEVSPYNPVDKQEYQDIGGKLLPKSGITGQLLPSGAIAKTQTPGEIESNKLGWFNATKPQFNADAGGFVSIPSNDNPQGALTKLPGFNKPMTESQSNANIFATRANESHRALTDLEGKYARAGVGVKAGLEGVWGAGGLLGAGMNEFVNSPATQKAEQAQRDFVNSVLRKESGAAISPSEFENARKQYFPQVGDSPEVVEQKRKNRILEIQGLQAATGQGSATPFEVYQGGGPMSFKAVPGQSTMSSGGWSAVRK